MDQSLLLTGTQEAFIKATSPDLLNDTPGTSRKPAGAIENDPTTRIDRARMPDAERPAFAPPVVRSPLTTRLHPKTANALKRAYLERKLAGIVPNTQQEIVESALDDWLTAHGYL